jgi:CheY-like chemotaxis protein
MLLLVVEDHVVHARLLRRALRSRLPGCEVELIADGLAAARRLADPAAPVPELVVLDLDLPGRSGHELLQDRARDPRLADVPVVVVTSADGLADAELSLRLGARAHLRKPLDADGFGALADELAGLLAMPPA